MRALVRQLPLLFFVLGVNTDLLAWSFLGRGPSTMTVGVPSVLTALFVWRGVSWWRLRAPGAYGLALARHKLSTVVPLSLILGVGCSSWALSLCRWGGEAEILHVAFYISVTVIGCIFCLMQTPGGAFTLIAAVMIPFFCVFSFLPGRHAPLVAVNAALIVGALMIVLQTQYRAFTALIRSRERLLAAQADTEALHTENMRLANLDLLTGLPNRRIFFETLSARLAAGERIAVALVDLDGFKPVNDMYGHAIGDEVLQTAAARLAPAAAPGSVARLGGDEFAVIVSGCVDSAELISWAEGICDVLRHPYVLSGAVVRLSASIGVSPFASRWVNGSKMLEFADYALYSVKNGHRGGAGLFTREHARELRRVSAVSQALRVESLEDELSLSFQAIVDSHTGVTKSFEALARWRSPTLGQVSPQEFIGVAERSGLVSRLTLILLRKALAAAATWPTDVRLSFNLSGNDLMSVETMTKVYELVSSSPVDPSRLDFEITETALMADFEKAATSLSALRALGCGLSLDDFGTGRSSLSYVHRLPLDKIKIDRSFIADLGEAGSAEAIVGAIVAMCRNLNLECIVEGVETTDQLLRLRQLGCRMVQGYLFSRPIEASSVIQYLAQSQVQTLTA